MGTWARKIVVLGAVLALGGCAADGDVAGTEDGEDDAFVGADGKADGPFNDCEQREALAFVNAPATGVPELRAAGLTTRAAGNVVTRRNGDDALPGTSDDRPYPSLRELDAVPYIGPASFRKLVARVQARCEAAPTGTAEVIFSPQPADRTHTVRVAQEIDRAERSVDIAMYSLSHAGVMDALERAVLRGVSIRMLFDPASSERSAPAGTTSERLERMGVDVRWVNLVMHHKFAIVDGPRLDAAAAETALLVTGSGNWSSGAGTRYDENTVFLRGDAEAVLRFQREFNYVWERSRPLDLNPALHQVTSVAISDDMMRDDPALDAVFTSSNFRVFTSSLGPGFSVLPNRNAVADRLVELIRGAERSIWIASGHFASRPVAEALLAKKRERPSIDIRVYVDGQEYLSLSAYRDQQSRQQACLTAAGTDAVAQQRCYDRDFIYGLTLHQAGIPVRYKYYAYRWDNAYALQMHHKYFIVDGRTVVSGSYNLSDNAEHNTIENVVIYEASGYAELVRAFEANFSQIWETGRAEGRFATLLTQVQTGTGPFPIVFDPMALTWDDVTTLKSAIRVACPDINTADFRDNAPAHRICYR